jgi:hypothetical protein
VTDRDPGFRIMREVAVLDVAKVQDFVQVKCNQQVGVQVTAACASGKTVLVAKPRTMIPCTVTDTPRDDGHRAGARQRHHWQHQDLI